MRVCIDASYGGRGFSGTGVYIVELSKALRALGVDVVEAAPRRPHRYLDLAREMAWVNGALPRRARGALVLHHALPALSRTTRLPQVVTVHDLAFERVPWAFNARFRRVARLRHRAAARGAAVVVTPSEATRMDVRSRWGVDAVVIPHGPGQAPPPGRGEARHFLYVGDDEPRKNLDGLLAAYARYRDRVADPLDLVLAGRARSGSASILHGAARSRLTPILRGVRVEPEPDLADLHRHAAALVIPSFHEGFGLPALEAMHAGTPVLAARTAGLAEVCADAARYCDPADVASIAAGLEELGTVPPLREELRRRGTARAAAFSWERCARAHVAAYERAIASRPR